MQHGPWRGNVSETATMIPGAELNVEAMLATDEAKALLEAGKVAGSLTAEEIALALVELDLEPGVYVATCFIPGEKGQPHAMEGMATAFEVT